MQEVDLESLEELLTSSRHFGPYGPFGSIAVGRFHFCNIFVMFFVSFVHVLLMEFDLHFGSMLASFSIFLHYFFEH